MLNLHHYNATTVSQNGRCNMGNSFHTLQLPATSKEA